jgi:hypothetical protein
MGKMKLDYETADFLRTMAQLAIAAACVLLLTYAEPVAPPFLCALGLLYLLRRKTHPLVQVTREFLWCVVIGLGIVLLCYGLIVLCLNGLSATALTPAVRSAEEYLSVMKERVEALQGWKPSLFIAGGVIVLVLLTRLVPRWQLLGRFTLLRTWFSRVALVLSIITAYSFFPGNPIVGAVDNHAVALVRETRDNQRKTLAALALQTQARTMNADTKAYYRDLFGDPRIDDDGVPEALVEQQVKETPEEKVAGLVTPPADPSPEAPPQRRRLSDLDAETRASARDYNVALEGAKLIFGQVLGLQHFIDGPLGEYVTDLVETSGDMLVDKGFEWTRLTKAHDAQNDLREASDKVFTEKAAREEKQREQEDHAREAPGR